MFTLQREKQMTVAVTAARSVTKFQASSMNTGRATAHLLRNSLFRICSTRLFSWSASISTAVVVEKSFSKTLLLPKTSFPLWADPSKCEAPFQKRTCEDLYMDQVCIVNLSLVFHVTFGS